MVLERWTVIGELIVLLWHTEIENIEEYLVHSFALLMRAS